MNSSVKISAKAGIHLQEPMETANALRFSFLALCDPEGED